MEAVEVAADGEDLWNGGELSPAPGVRHLPAQPVYARRHGQSGGWTLASQTR
jgi:hypothetical protein